jgi:phosphatidylserine/phosphatidylglycerophosphate/cardiolipin synthase-like enzyme
MTNAIAKAIAIPNNDYVHIAWDFRSQLTDCGGFAVYRLTQNGPADGMPLPAFARDAQGKRLKITCEDQPIRKYSWRDVFETRGGTYRYRIVAMSKPKQPLEGVDPIMTSWVTVSPRAGNAMVYFNRGLLATQHTADDIWDPAHQKPDFAKIEALINDENSHLRKSLSGQLFEALTLLLDRAKKDGGSCWASLYELTDECLIDRLAECDNLHLILSNDNDEKDKKVVYDGKNQAAAKTLHPTAQEIIRRYMPQGQIGHNKFVIYVDSHRRPKAVLTGSTNWTASGLCTQSNNAILIESEPLAERYLQYWKELKSDALAAGIPKQPSPVRAIQAKELRAECAVKPSPIPLNQNSTVTAWFSPNAASVMRSGKQKTQPPVPADLAEIYDLFAHARQSVLFLAFMPGMAGAAMSFHFLKELGKVSAQKPELFVRGAVSDPGLTREFDLATLTANATNRNEDSMIASPQGIFKNFNDWRKEIYKYGHAIIHDKVIVVDPFDEERCAVITGSHNLGFRASSNNDENMLIIRGDAAIAQAYAAHVMDIFEHYRSRWINASNANRPNRKDYDPNQDPNWQQKYFDDSRPAYAERLFWVSGGTPLPALAANLAQKYARERLEKEDAGRKAAAAARKAAKGAAKKAPRKKAAKA